MSRNFPAPHFCFSRQRSSVLAISIATLLSLRMVSPSLGVSAVESWTGATNASWDTTANWSLGAAPGPGAAVSFPATIPTTGSTITLSNDETANSLGFSNSYTLSGSGSLALGTGTVSVSSGSTATINSLISSGSVAATGTGTLILANSSNNYSGGTTVNSGATLIANGTPIYGTWTTLGTGTLTINGGTIGTTIEADQGTTLANPITVNGDFSIETNIDLSNPGLQQFTLNGTIDLTGATRTITGVTKEGVVNLASIGLNGETAGVTFNTSFTSAGDYVAFVYESGSTNHYTGLTTITNDAYLVLEGNTPGGSIKGNVDIEGTGVLDYLAGASNQINNSSATVTVNSVGGTVGGTYFGGLDLYTSTGDTIGTLLGGGVISLGAGILTVNGGNFGGLIFDGDHSGFSGGGIKKVGAGMFELAGNDGYTGATTVTGGTLVVNGSIATSSGVVVSHGAELSGHGSVSKISGAGLIAPSDLQILTATQVNPSSGLSFAFSFTQSGSSTYSDAGASGNDVLHITGSTPFVFSLTSANMVTLDFSGATLLANQTYLGGFFTDTDIANSVVNGADFIYTGLNGAVVQYEGLVEEPSAAFASGTVTNGEVMEFKVTSPAPEPSTVTMLLGGAGAFVSFKRRRRGNRRAYSRAALSPTRLRA